MKKISFLLFAFLLSANVFSQRITVMGRVVDSISGAALKDVTVSAFSLKDTALLNFSFTTKNGNYYMEVNGQDSILVTFSYFAYKEKIRKWKNQTYWRSTEIKLAPDPKWNLLKGATLRTSPITMRGDTIEINASRFKVLPGSDVAQLFKKIPGFEVDVSGSVKVNGKDINKIMVDGSDFFGNNPALVSKTLQADMIEKVQVFEEKDKNGELVQDGEILINLKLKKGANNGFFGDAILGAGTNELFEAGLRYNSFKEDRKLSIIANGNNTNNSGFDFGFNSWHGWISDRGIGQSWDDKPWEYGAYSISNDGNINNTSNYGVSYFNELKPKVKVSGNVVYSQKLYDNENFSLVENFISDTTSRIIENNNVSRGIKDILSYKVAYSDNSDSMFQYDLVFKGSLEDGTRRQEENNEISINNSLINSSTMLALSEQRLFKNQIALDMGGRTGKGSKFAYWGAEFMVGQDNESTNLLRYNVASTDSFNIKNDRFNENQFIRSELSLYIPIIKKKLSARVSTEYYRQDNNFSGIAFNAQTLQPNFEQPYMQVVDTLSTEMKNIATTQTTNLDLSYYNDDFYVSAELAHLNANFNGNALLLNDNISLDNSYSAWLPEFYISHGRRSKFRKSFSYSRNYSLPSGTDLLPAYNVFQIWNRAVGNPNLGLALTDNFNLWLNKRMIKGLFRYVGFNSSYDMSDEYKVTSTFTDENGLALTSPTILDGYRNLSVNTNTALRLYKKLLSLTVNGRYTNTDRPLLFNDEKFINSTENYQGTLGLDVAYSDSLSFNFGYNINQFSNSNSRSESLDFSQLVQSYNGSLRAVAPWGTQFNITFELTDQRDIPEIGRFIPILSAYVQHPVLKNGKLDLKFTAFDIFKENVGISRSVNAGFISIRQQNLLQQYFMLTAVYKIKNMGGETRKYVW